MLSKYRIVLNDAGLNSKQIDCLQNKEVWFVQKRIFFIFWLPVGEHGYCSAEEAGSSVIELQRHDLKVKELRMIDSQTV